VTETGLSISDSRARARSTGFGLGLRGRGHEEEEGRVVQTQTYRKVVDSSKKNGEKREESDQTMK